MYVEENKAKAFFYSVIVYLTLVFLCFLGVITVPIENKPVQGGVEVNIGTSYVGMGNDITSTEEPAVRNHVNHRVRTEVTSQTSEKASLHKEIVPKEALTQSIEDAAALGDKKAGRKENTVAAVRKPAPKRHTETVNENALYKGSPKNGNGAGDGNGDQPGNQGKPTGSVLSDRYSGTGSGNGGVTLNLEGRRFLVKPSLTDDGQTEGRIAVEISVDRDGSVSSAKAGGRGTTIQNAALWRKCEEAVNQSKLNRIEGGPEIETGRVIFSFKLQ